MKRAGRVSLLLLAAFVAVVVAVVIIFSVSRTASPITAGTDFMEALTRGDVKRLTELTYMDGVTPADIQKKWDYTMKVVAPYYHFTYEIDGGGQTDDTDAAVRIQLTKNRLRSGAYPENYELPLVKVNGAWLVDVRSLNRSFFPGLPR